ncbi:TetR/AcrR family transcriptional regulator [Rhodoplanes sp. TEM]|uniref:TetR/AcrR family transcriptional regulator n=1 Tax=Rhodoplanes tepidamans TaxID=200616 RepID=A0ABT5JLA3_RHOTP|nr:MULTISPECIES: TetR/AcrR family transcriptional regulator [Rhodoplanes]MDC7790023.1 TetR/AcrR family transcriptional regulator [Rhodoplanes tepidamans]MDC7987120.1 TetR/AcrR family transcriptional regulator [Rhodoplanes sp. TEM]MDQ0357515.1 AcrR family transcriptional regulator [Rhodoplanes tepidamans]
MPRTAEPTRRKILAAATRLFYGAGIRAVSLDEIAAAAGVTKKTLYYHFRSKDDLVGAYLAARDAPNLALFRRWFDEAGGDLADRVRAIFRNLARAARHPKWRGCGFLRTSVEYADLPGHPAIRTGIAHKKRVEAWLEEMLAADGIAGAPELSRQVMLLLDGSFAVVLLHRDPTYMETAGDAAFALITAAQGR